MSTETHTIPDDTAAHYERLITEAEKMRQAGADALKAAYADLRADLKQLGWAGASISAEVAAFKGAIAEMALAEADKTKRDEKGERIDDYVSLLTRARARGQRKNDDQFDPLTGEFVDDNEASDGSPSVSSSLTTREPEESVVSHSPETANEACRASQDAAPVTGRPAEPVNSLPTEGCEGYAHTEGNATQSGVTAGETATISNTDAAISRPELDRPEIENRPEEEAPEAGASGGMHDESAFHPAAHSEKATVATQGEATAPTSDERETDLDEAAEGDRVAANAGGGHVDGGALRANRDENGEGAASTLSIDLGVFMEDVPQMPMKRPGFAHCFPELSNAAYDALGTDIAFKGIQAPIVRQGDVIVDGWARYNIARDLGISYPVQEYSGSDVLLDLIEWQRASRNFSPAQERKIAAELAKELPHRAGDIMAAFGLAEALEAAE